MSDLRALIKGWLDENAKEYYGISMENANAALWAFEDVLDKVNEMQKVIDTAVMFLQGNEMFVKAEQIKSMSQALKGNQ